MCRLTYVTVLIAKFVSHYFEWNHNHTPIEIWRQHFARISVIFFATQSLLVVLNLLGKYFLKRYQFVEKKNEKSLNCMWANIEYEVTNYYFELNVFYFFLKMLLEFYFDAGIPNECCLLFEFNCCVHFAYVKLVPPFFYFYSRQI